MKKAERWLQYFSYLTILLSFLTVATLVFWWTYPYEVVTQINRIQVLNEDGYVPSGGLVNTLWKIEKKTDVKPRVSRLIVCDNAVSYSVDSFNINLETGRNEVIVPVQIPPIPAPATCVLKWTATYRVNPVREISVNFESESFEVRDAN